MWRVFLHSYFPRLTTLNHPKPEAIRSGGQPGICASWSRCGSVGQSGEPSHDAGVTGLCSRLQAFPTLKVIWYELCTIVITWCTTCVAEKFSFRHDSKTKGLMLRRSQLVHQPMKTKTMVNVILKKVVKKKKNLRMTQWWQRSLTYIFAHGWSPFLWLFDSYIYIHM